MIAQELEVSLHMAFVDARQQRHEFITVEHLLLCLLDNSSVAEVLKACAANIDDLRKSLTTFTKENTPTVVGTEKVDTKPTLGFDRVIQRAMMHAQSRARTSAEIWDDTPVNKEVTGANVLLAIFGEKDSHAVYYLHQQNVTRLNVTDFIAGLKSIQRVSSGAAGVQEVQKALGTATVYRIEINVIAPPEATPESTQRIVELLRRQLFGLPLEEKNSVRVFVSAQSADSAKTD